MSLPPPKRSASCGISQACLLDFDFANSSAQVASNWGPRRLSTSRAENIYAAGPWGQIRRSRLACQRGLRSGGEPAKLLTPVEASVLPPLQFKAWQQKDLTLIPSPTFVYSDFYALGYTSLTVAPPKVGKSTLALAEAIDIATGQSVCKITQAISPQTLLCANGTGQATS